MPGVTITLDKASLRSTQNMLAGIRNGLPKALAGAVNDTVKHTKSEVSRRIRESVNIKKQDIDKYIRRSWATANVPAAQVELDKGKRIGLEHFGARQTKEGVTYAIKRGGGRQSAPRAFVVPDTARKGAGLVFKRKPAGAGTADTNLVGRLPVFKLMGPSAWGVFVMSGMLEPTKEDTAENLEKNVRRRVNLALLRKAGAVQ
jgi:hypothetical protein